MKGQKYLFLLWILIFSFSGIKSAFAAHLTGGDFTYFFIEVSLGNNRYALTLDVFKDCIGTNLYPTNTPFDVSLGVTAFDAETMKRVTSVSVRVEDSVDIPITPPDSCAPRPGNLCYKKARYHGSITLPNNTAGYYLVWTRCCRNNTIQNIINPAEAGMVFSTYIPGSVYKNSSPEFVNQFPSYICQYESFQFDHSATDRDGDSVVYSLSTPLTGGSINIPIPPSWPPPHHEVNFLPPYTTQNPIGGSPQMEIDPQTGLLTVRPTSPGRFVFAVTAKEYRNGVLMSYIIRDIQINIVSCPINFPPQVFRPDTSLVIEDTLLFYRGSETCLSFTVTDTNGMDVPIDQLNVEASGKIFTNNNGARFYAESGPGPIKGTICWNPSCEIESLSDPRIFIKAQDTGDCMGPNITLDTLYIKLLPPKAKPPQPLSICAEGVDAVKINWQPIPESEQNGFSSYYLYRQINGNWVFIDSISDPASDFYVDHTSGNNQNRNFCYRLQTARICPEFYQGEPSESVCMTSSDQVEFCRATVDDSTQSIRLEWSVLDSTAISGFRIYRKADTDLAFSLVAELDGTTQESWLDQQVRLMETGYCYQLKLVDLCGEEILIKEHCPVFLQINENQDQLTLNWKAYQGWDGVSEYEIYEILPNNERLKVQALPGLAHTYSLGTAPLEKSRHCYQIQAMESGNNCGITSFSNLACYEFEPRIFIPNAFTPNGDGQNDIWEIRGGFMRDFQIRIFNRWGKIVFESYSLTNSWDGTFGGRAVPEGVYVYQVRAWDEAGALIERGGSVAVIR